MRFFLPLLTMTLIGIAAAADVIRLSEPVAVTETHEIFGAQMDSELNARPLGEVVDAYEAFDGQPVHVTTRVRKVCQEKGCFFIARHGDAIVRVTFADYEFFIPTDASGKEVSVVGTFKVSPISQEEANHYAQDLGEAKPAPLEQDFEFAIVATSIMIPRS
ncbi:MAG: DUF4920 domain-containing protein [Xanthomonadales bacterium]|nr:DUF4920 domain-containing protein [Xanthomonadales bacterium]